MKKAKLNSKLNLNKSTVSGLNNVVGGAEVPTKSCVKTCGCTASKVVCCMPSAYVTCPNSDTSGMCC